MSHKHNQCMSADISAHYETMDNSEPQAQPVSADISAHYETMDNSEPQAQPVSADISAHYETIWIIVSHKHNQ